jgi:glycosyltransferase involved in cell wall biosynthesis
MTAENWRPQSLSIVVPVFNEEENVKPLVSGIVEAVSELGVPFEVIVIDDGSTDSTSHVLHELTDRVRELVVIVFRRNFGQTLALQAGLDRARGEVIVTMDGDCQNDPRDIERLLDEMSRGADVVSGWRKDRKDTLVMRKIPSWIANRMIRGVTGVTVHDQGCSLKAYRREVVQKLDLYADMHRFITILAMPLGARISEVVVRHHPRVAGDSKYGISRTFKVIADLFTIQMLTRFRESPLRFFALIGMPFLLLGMISGSFALFAGIPGTVLVSVTFLSLMTFANCIFLGVLGETVVFEEGQEEHESVSALTVSEWRNTK